MDFSATIVYCVHIRSVGNVLFYFSTNSKFDLRGRGHFQGVGGQKIVSAQTASVKKTTICLELVCGSILLRGVYWQEPGIRYVSQYRGDYRLYTGIFKTEFNNRKTVTAF